MKNVCKGSKFDDFLEEEDLLDQAEATAVKRVIAYQIEQVMKKQRVSKKALDRCNLPLSYPRALC